MAEEKEKIEETKAKSPLDMRMLIVFGVIMIVTVLIAVVVAIKIAAPPSSTQDANKAKTEEVDTSGTIIDISEDIVTNLADADGSRLIKFKFSYEVTDSKLADKTTAKENESKIRHSVLGILRKKTSNDVKGSEGFTKLQRDLKDELNKSIFKGKVKQVYISDFVVE